MEKHFAEFSKTLETEGREAAYALLEQDEFHKGFIRVLMTPARDMFASTLEAHGMREKGNYSYSKALHKAIQGFLFVLKAQVDMQEQTRRISDVHDQRRIRALEDRVKELEAAPLQYDGPHETGKVYGKGMFVTHEGSLWHCNYKTASRPGDGPAWTLAVKRGKDAR